MTKVIIERACGCVKRAEMQMEKEFPNVDEALAYGNELVSQMNEEFCGKHKFVSVFENESVVIKMAMNG